MQGQALASQLLDVRTELSQQKRQSSEQAAELNAMKGEVSALRRMTVEMSRIVDASLFGLHPKLGANSVSLLLANRFLKPCAFAFIMWGCPPSCLATDQHHATVHQGLIWVQGKEFAVPCLD